jgi:uncharacterized protein DUF4160
VSRGWPPNIALQPTSPASPPPRLSADVRRRAEMSPTVFRDGGLRVFFFSREEPRMHVHVQSAEAEAKFWMEPRVELAVNHGFPDHELVRIQKLLEGRDDEIRQAWGRHFPS